MSQNGFQHQRAKRLNLIIRGLQIAKNTGKKVNFREFSANLAITMGVTIPKIEEYFRLLEDSKFIEIDKKKDKIELLAENSEDLGENAIEK